MTKQEMQKLIGHNLLAEYTAQRDIAKFADVLGHSSIETTRIYLLSSGQEHQAVLDRLQRIC